MTLLLHRYFFLLYFSCFIIFLFISTFYGNKSIEIVLLCNQKVAAEFAKINEHVSKRKFLTIRATPITIAHAVSDTAITAQQSEQQQYDSSA